MPRAGPGPSPWLCWSLPAHGGGSPLSFPMSPFPLSLSRGDQCLTNNSTYFEIAIGNTTLVKHGEQHRRAQPLGLSSSPFLGQARTHKGPMSMFYIV